MGIKPIYFGLYWAFVIYTIYEGFIQGFLYHYKNQMGRKATENENYNLHGVYVIQRLIVSVILCLCISLYSSVCDAGLFLLTIALCYSFFHNGMYYLTRNRLQEGAVLYPKGWKDHSETSTAKFNLSWRLRFVLFLGSITMLIYLMAK